MLNYLFLIAAVKDYSALRTRGCTIPDLFGGGKMPCCLAVPVGIMEVCLVSYL